MKKKVIIICIVLVFVVIGVCLNRKTDFQTIVNNSIVYIESYNNEMINSCSGFVYDNIDNKTYIVTAYHCIDNYNNIYVYNQVKKKEKANIELYDINNDIAILSIENNLSLRKVKISKNIPSVGDDIFVIGTPLDINYSGTLTHGIISYVNREISIKKENNIVTYKTFQIDASINSGSSGSVLLDSNGRALGMIIVKDNNLDGVSFAIPIDKVINLIKKI